MQLRHIRQLVVIGALLVTGLSLSSSVFADDNVKGVITGRGDDGSWMVQKDDATTVALAIDDATKVRRRDGARSKTVSSSALMPGLRIDAHGKFENESRFVATRVNFDRSDLKVARDIEGGVSPTDKRSVANQQRLDQHAQALTQHGQAIQNQGQQLQQQGDRIGASEQKIIATTGALSATNSRIGNLDNYNVVNTMTVYFPNGKANIPSKYKSQLEQFATQARGVDGYIVQIQGYASKVGSAALNQQLSMKRADAVTAILQQNGVVLSNVVVPAAMGTTEQVASNKTAKGQAENRRAVVTILQNKGIANK